MDTEVEAMLVKNATMAVEPSNKEVVSGHLAHPKMIKSWTP